MTYRIRYNSLYWILCCHLLNNLLVAEKGNCKIVHSKNRTITLNMLQPNSNNNSVVGFIKENEKIFTRDDLKSIENKFNVKMNHSCVNVRLTKNNVIPYKNTMLEENLIKSINNYLKTKREMIRTKNIRNIRFIGQSSISQDFFAEQIIITYFKNIEGSEYEVRFLYNNKEIRFIAQLNLVAPTLIARKGIAEASVLKRNLFHIKYVKYNENNFTLKDWKTTSSPLISKKKIKKGEILTRGHFKSNIIFSKKITAVFNCKYFSITKQLNLKRVKKEYIELEDPNVKKLYIATPVDFNRAQIMCNNLRSIK